MKIVITGATGLLGWHAAARLHSATSAARFRNKLVPYSLVRLDHLQVDDDPQRCDALSGADAVLHFAGVNRASDADVEIGNLGAAQRLAEACATTRSFPHIVYANSTHSANDTPYGRSKRIASQILGRVGDRYTDLILPHIFGECARPRYNNVTATFIEAVIKGQTPDINPDGKVELLHAGAAAQAAIEATLSCRTGVQRLAGRETKVLDLFALLQDFHVGYEANIFPDLRDPFVLCLFNSYRAALYPDGFPRPLPLNTDPRGTLFEAVKGGGGGQTFLSTTLPGVTRGNHFHLGKVERFLVVQGEAIIRVRRVLSDKIWEYRVSGETPAVVDMPTLHTHCIENVGSVPLLTMFWSHDLFDSKAPDTFFDPVEQG